MSDDIWSTAIGLAFANEADVETRLILPLLEALGWPRSEVHAKVPVNFRVGRRPGRKPEADVSVR